MRLAQSTLQKVKVVLHAVQGFAIFIAACVAIGVLSKSTRGDGRTGWYFAVCFLTVPAFLYQVGVPMWSRTIRFAKAYAFAAVDFVYALLWLIAFAAVAAWNRAGILQGAANAKIPDTSANCTVFAYGKPEACHLAYAATVFGVIIFLGFLATGTISVLYIQRIRKDPAAEDPWLAKGGGGGAQPYAPAGGDIEGLGRGSKDPVWDHDTQEIDNPFNHEDDEREDDGQGYDMQHYRPDEDDHGRDPSAVDDDYVHLHSGTETHEGHHPGRQVNWGRQSATPHMPHVDTEYRGSRYGPGSYQTPSALSPDTRASPRSPDGFPPYEEYPTRAAGRDGSRYSFSRPPGEP